MRPGALRPAPAGPSVVVCACILTLLFSMPAVPLAAGGGGASEGDGCRSTPVGRAYLTCEVLPDPIVVRPGEPADVTLAFEEWNNVAARVEHVTVTFLTPRGAPVCATCAPVRLTIATDVPPSSRATAGVRLDVPPAVAGEAFRLGLYRLSADMRFRATSADCSAIALAVTVTVELESKVAVLVDGPLLPYIRENLTTYERDVSSLLRVEFVERAESWATPEAVREEILALWRDEGISGAILVGHLPIARWELVRGPDDVERCQIPIFYEDLDGSFADVDGNGLYDRHYWGPNDGPEIWASFIVPPREAMPADHLDPNGEGTGGGLVGRYYDNDDLTGLRLTRVDPVIDFRWQWSARGIFSTTMMYSVLWTGRVLADVEEDYTFSLVLGGGARLWVDGALVMDLRDQEAFHTDEDLARVHLAAGWHALRLEYHANNWCQDDAGFVDLAWCSTSVVGANLNEWFAKAHAYRTGALDFPARGLLFFDWGYGIDCDMLPRIKDPYVDGVYGEHVYVGCNYTMSADDYLEALDDGAEVVMVFSHACPWGHCLGSRDPPPGEEGYAETWRIVNRTGGVVTLIGGCHAADFGPTDEGAAQLSLNLAVNYAHTLPNGLACIGNARSFGSTFEQTFDSLAMRSYLGIGYLAYKDAGYNRTFREQNDPGEGHDRWINDEVLLGDPFVTADHHPRDLSVEIEGGARYTDERTVALTLAGKDVEEVRIRNEGDQWSAWMPFCATMTWALPAGSGGASVEMQARNGYGEGYETASDAICRVPGILEVTGLELAGGAAYTASATVDLEVLTAPGSPPPAEMRVRGGDGEWAYWAPFAARSRWTLPSGDGNKTVTVEVRDSVDILHAVVSDTIVLDTTPPVMTMATDGTMGKAGWYVSPVRAIVTAVDAICGAVPLEYTLDGTTWLPYVGPLSIQDGEHHLMARCKDAAGNQGWCGGTLLGVDTTPPVLEIPMVACGNGNVRIPCVHVDLVASDAGSGLARVATADLSGDWGPWQTYIESFDLMFDPVEGQHAVRVRVADAAGNVAESEAYYFVFDKTPPRILEVSPAPGSTGVVVGAGVSVSFSEGMDAGTIGADAVIVADAAGVPVPGNVSFNPVACLLTFRPNEPLARFARYNVSVSGRVCDAAGNVLEGGPLQWEFTTEGALPGAPVGLKATAVKRSVVLDWTAPAYMGSGAFLGYRVYRATVAGGVAGEPVLLTRVLGLTYTDAAVEWNTTYRYTVGAMTEFGEGPAGGPADATPVEEVAPPDDDDVVPPGTVDLHVAGPTTGWAIVAIAIAVTVVAGEAIHRRLKPRV